MTVKIWDVNMERQPIKTIPIHEHLRPRLCDTYENDSIFDKFEVVFSGDAKNVMTGSYNNNFMIYPSDPEKDTEVVLQADKSAFKAKKVGIPTPMNSSTSPTSGTAKKGSSRAGSPAAGAVGSAQRMRKETDADQIDFNKKILHMSWHPFEDSIAIAATNNVSLTLLQNVLYMLTVCVAIRILRLVELASIWNSIIWAGVDRLQEAMRITSTNSALTVDFSSRCTRQECRSAVSEMKIKIQNQSSSPSGAYRDPVTWKKRVVCLSDVICSLLFSPTRSPSFPFLA